jgi:hypothetical protein
VKANKDTRKILNGSTELKRLEEERERLINQFLAEPGQLSVSHSDWSCTRSPGGGKEVVKTLWTSRP